MSNILIWILAAIAVERMTEVLHAGAILERPRDWILRKNNFFSDLFGCGFCLSVWVAGIFAWSLPGPILACSILTIVIKTFALQGLSNLVHGLFGLWGEMVYRAKERIPWIIAFQKVEIHDSQPNKPQDLDGDPSDHQGLHAGEEDDRQEDTGRGDA